MEGFLWVSGRGKCWRLNAVPAPSSGTCLHPLAAFSFAYEMDKLSIEREPIRFIFLICTHCWEVKPKSGILNLSQAVELFLFSKGFLVLDLASVVYSNIWNCRYGWLVVRHTPQHPMLLGSLLEKWHPSPKKGEWGNITDQAWLRGKLCTVEASLFLLVSPWSRLSLQ